MGSGYNDSLAASRGARTRASTRTPIHFWLTVPMYQYDIGCGTDTRVHIFMSRTPVIAIDDEDSCVVWCENCQEFRVIDSPEPEPLNQPISNDEKIAFEQDKGLLRERIGLAIQDAGYLESDEKIREFILRDWSLESGFVLQVPNREIKKLNAGLKAPEGLSGQPDLCKAGLHEMTIDNIKIKSGRRSCLACHREKDRQSAARRRKKA